MNPRHFLIASAGLLSSCVSSQGSTGPVPEHTAAVASAIDHLSRCDIATARKAIQALPEDTLRYRFATVGECAQVDAFTYPRTAALDHLEAIESYHATKIAGCSPEKVKDGGSYQSFEACVRGQVGPDFISDRWLRGKQVPDSPEWASEPKPFNLPFCSLEPVFQACSAKALAPFYAKAKAADEKTAKAALGEQQRQGICVELVRLKRSEALSAKQFEATKAIFAEQKAKMKNYEAGKAGVDASLARVKLAHETALAQAEDAADNLIRQWESFHGAKFDRARCE
jgi:hypothetical protein